MYMEVKKYSGSPEVQKKQFKKKESHVGKGEEGMVLSIGSCCTLYAR